MAEITRLFCYELERRLAQKTPFMQAVLGPRQVGKTTGVLLIGRRWQGPFTYATADLPSSPGPDWIREQWQTARAKGANGLLAIDEVQKIPHWSEMTKSLFDEERRRSNPLQVVLLGSAGWLVQSGLSESLAGRFEILPVPHWSLSECKTAFGWDLFTFLKYGGYPAPAQLIHETARWQQFIRDSIIEPMLARDLLSVRSLTKPALFRQTLELAMHYPAQEISLQKLLGQLQDKGNSTTIKGYLELLESGFVIRILSKYSTRPLTTKSASPKLLPLCGALIHAFENPTRVDSDPEWRGRVFEAAIGASLVRLFPKVSYWREGNNEIDFIAEDSSSLLAIEVKSGRVRKNQNFSAFSKQHKHEVRCLTLDVASGEQFLLANNPREFLDDIAHEQR